MVGVSRVPLPILGSKEVTEILARIMLGSIIFVASLVLAGSLIPGAAAQQAQTDSDHLARFVAVIQYIRSTPTAADVRATNIALLATLDASLSDIYIAGFITPYTGETRQQVKARLQSVDVEDRFTAVMVESYRLSPNPLLLDIVHQLLPLYYVQLFTTATDPERLGRVPYTR